MRRLTIVLVCVLLACCSLMGVGCSKDNSTIPAVNSVTITDKPTGAMMSVGDTHKLSYSYSPSDAAAPTVEWSSSDDTIATVSSDGLLQANAAGVVKITVAVKGSEIKDQFALTVTAVVTVNPATAIAISNKPTDKVYVGVSFTLTAVLTAQDTERDCSDSYVWSSSDDTVLTVNESGEVTPKKPGTAIVTVAVVGKTNTLFDTYTVDVYPEEADGYKDTLVNATINNDPVYYEDNNTVVKTTATFESELFYVATRQENFSYSLDNDETHKGALLATGSSMRQWDRTYFELKHDDMLDNTKNYTVRVSVTLVSLNNTYNNDPDAAAEFLETVDWQLGWFKVSDTDRMSDVSNPDTKKSILNGNPITITTQNGDLPEKFTQVGDTVEFLVNTTEPIRGFCFGTAGEGGNNSTYTLRFNYVQFTEYVAVEGFEISNKNDVATVRTDATGANAKTLTYFYTNNAGESAASNFEVIWKSSDETVLTVDESGKITPVGEGTATVTATVKGQKTATDNVSITVQHVKVNGIFITKNGETITSATYDLNGKTAPYTLTLGHKPANDPCAYTVSWSSSNEQVATVDNDGVVTINKTGTTRITVQVNGQADQSASVTLTVDDSSIVKNVASIAIKVNGVLAGNDNQVIYMDDDVTLTYEATLETGGSNDFTVTWTSDNIDYIAIPAGSSKAESVTLEIKAISNTPIAVTVKVDGDQEIAEATVYFIVKQAPVRQITVSGISAIQTIRLGESKACTVIATPSDCEDYTLEFAYTTAGVVSATATQDGFVLVAIGEGTTEFNVSVEGKSSVKQTFTVTVTDSYNGVSVENIAKGKIEESMYYVGTYFNISATINSSTPNTVKIDANNRLIWKVNDTRNYEKLWFNCNSFASLDFTGGKKYVARVGLTPIDPSNTYFEKGYSVIYGYTQLSDSATKYFGGDIPIRRLITKPTTYFDFTLDGTYSEFFIAFNGSGEHHPDGRNAASVQYAISVCLIDLQNPDLDFEQGALTETFEDKTTADNIAAYQSEGQKYTGTNFDIYSDKVSGDIGKLSVEDFGRTAGSMFTEGQGLLWSSNAYTKDTNVTIEPKLTIEYKGTVDASKAYFVRIPISIMTTASSSSGLRPLLQSTYIELRYGTTGGSVLIDTQYACNHGALVVFEVEIPAGSGWDGMLTLHLYHDTNISQEFTVQCRFDGISVRELAVAATSDDSAPVGAAAQEVAYIDEAQYANKTKEQAE